MFLECLLSGSGGGSLETYATIDVCTNEDELAGQTIGVSFQSPTYIISSIKISSTRSVIDGLYHAKPINVQSIGMYSFEYDGNNVGEIEIDNFITYSVNLATLLRNYYPSENANGHASYNTVDQSSSAIRGGGLNKAFDSDTSIGCYFDPIKYGGNGSYWEWIFDTPIKVKSIKAILKGATGSTKTYKGYLFADSGSGYEQLKPYDFTMGTEENVLEYEFENITTVSKIKINCYDSTFSTSANLVSVCLNPT